MTGKTVQVRAYDRDTTVETYRRPQRGPGKKKWVRGFNRRGHVEAYKRKRPKPHTRTSKDSMQMLRMFTSQKYVRVAETMPSGKSKTKWIKLR